MSSPRVYWRGRIHPLGRIGGFPRGFITKLRKFHCATCGRSVHVVIAVPNVSKWPQSSASKRPPPSEHLKLTRCANAQANRRRKSKTLVQLSSSCRAKDVSVFSGTHRVWQAISQIPKKVRPMWYIEDTEHDDVSVVYCKRKRNILWNV